MPEAYEAFLKGRFESEKRTRKESRTPPILPGRDCQGSTFAAAYAGLADSLLNLSNYEIRAPAEVMPHAKAAVKKALQLDERLPRHTRRLPPFAFTISNGTAWRVNSSARSLWIQGMRRPCTGTP